MTSRSLIQKPCPFCGETPENASAYGRDYVRCCNKKCWLYEVLARHAEWNARADVSSSEIPVVAEIKPCPYINGFTADNAGVSFILQRYNGYSDFILFENGKPNRCFRFTQGNETGERGENGYAGTAAADANDVGSTPTAPTTPLKEEFILMALWWRAEDDTYKVAKPRFNLFSRDSDSLYVDVTDDGNHVSRYLSRIETTTKPVIGHVQDLNTSLERVQKNPETEQPVDCGVVESALRKAESTFLHYEKLHRAKPDHEKADRNRDLAMEMTQALASMPKRESGWQPIETAPRDGTPILAYIKYAESSLFPGRMAVVTPHIAYSMPEDDASERLTWQEAGGGYYGIRCTHWMPLPKSPEIEDREADNV